MLDIKLDTLLAVYEKKSFSKAADQLALTQPAVSNHINLLENQLNVKLCERNKGNIVFNMWQRIKFTRKYAKLEAPFVPVDLKQYGEVYVFCDSGDLYIAISGGRKACETAKKSERKNCGK